MVSVGSFARTHKRCDASPSPDFTRHVSGEYNNNRELAIGFAGLTVSHEEPI
jgi:hypothetical protein